MRRATVYLRETFAGELIEESSDKYIFRYDDDYFYNSLKSDISLTLSKQQQTYTSSVLFPFFANMLPEGQSKTVKATLLELSEKDEFGILMAIAQNDVSGAVTIKPF